MTSALETSGPKNIFFVCFFHTCGWFSTYLEYIPFENAKKAKNGSH
jgi:hypothetical protein